MCNYNYSTNQKLAFEYCSMYKASSENGAICKSPWDGNIFPEKQMSYQHITSVLVFIQTISNASLKKKKLLTVYLKNHECPYEFHA